MSVLKKLALVLFMVGTFISNGQVAGAQNILTDSDFDFTSIRRLIVCEANNSTEKDSLTNDVLYHAFLTRPDKVNLQISGIRDYTGKINQDQLSSLAKYAEVYMVPTVVRQRNTHIFFEVYEATTQKLIYSERVSVSGAQSAKLYEDATKQFYKEFNQLLTGKAKLEKKSDKAA